MTPSQGSLPDPGNALQSFAMQNRGTPNPTVLMSAIVDDERRRREQEKLELQAYYAGNGGPSLEVQFLGNESNQLAQVLQQLSPNDPNKVWTFEDFQSAVQAAKVKWETKKRLGGGKVQAVFHKLMGKFKAHSNLFSFIPNGSYYTSLVCWASTVLVDASVQHTDTVEELANVMEVINEAATLVEAESKLFQGEIVQKAVAKFYTAVFLLLGDVAMWYNSKSREKFFNSLHEGFHKQFADGLQNVQRMSAVVGRTASLAAAAEGRYVRLSMEDLRQELLDERAGLSGALRRIAQSMAEQFAAHVQRLEEQSRLEHEETRRQLLAAVGTQIQHTEASYKKVAENGWQFLRENLRRIDYDSPGRNGANQVAYPGQHLLQDSPGGQAAETQPNSNSNAPTIAQLQAQAEKLLLFVTKGARILNEPEDILPVATHERVTVAIGGWLQSLDSTLLYLEYPRTAGLLPEISLVAYRIVLAADSLNAPVISFFCRGTAGSDLDGASQKGDPMVGLVYSMTYQILTQLPTQQHHELINTSEDFQGLDATTWTKALGLFAKALQLVPPLALCIVDGLEEFERDQEGRIAQLVEVFRDQIRRPGKTLKVLFTSSARSFGLLGCLQGNEVDIVDTGVHSFGSRGRTLFIV